MKEWPKTAEALRARQEALAQEIPEPWRPVAPPRRIAACAICFGRGATARGARGDVGFAAAALLEDGRLVAKAVVTGAVPAAFQPGLLAMREGPLLEAAVRALPERPDVLLVASAGRDHPRRAGLALELGAALDLPTVGVTTRPLRAQGEPPGPELGARSPLMLAGERVGYWVRTRAGARPLVAHAAWRTDAETAAEVVRGASRAVRAPEALREARRAARSARARVELLRGAQARGRGTPRRSLARCWRGDRVSRSPRRRSR